MKTLSMSTLGIEPEIGAPARDRLISGDPVFRTWNIDEQPGGLFVGLWESTPGKWRVHYEEWEYCRILSGVSIVTEDGAATRRVTVGDSFVIRRALRAHGKSSRRPARNTSFGFRSSGMISKSRPRS